MDGEATPSGQQGPPPAKEVANENDSASPLSRHQLIEAYRTEQAALGNKMSYNKACDAFDAAEALEFDAKSQGKRANGAAAAPARTPQANLPAADATPAQSEDEDNMPEAEEASPAPAPAPERSGRPSKKARSTTSVTNGTGAVAAPKPKKGRARGRPKGAGAKKSKRAAFLRGLTATQKANSTYHPVELAQATPGDPEATESEATSGSSSSSGQRRGRPSLPKDNTYVMVTPEDGYETIEEEEEEEEEDDLEEGGAAPTPAAAAIAAAARAAAAAAPPADEAAAPADEAATLADEAQAAAADAYGLTDPMYHGDNAIFYWEFDFSSNADNNPPPAFEYKEGDLDDYGAPAMEGHEHLLYIDIFENLMGGDCTWNQFSKATNEKFEAWKEKKMDAEDDEVNQEDWTNTSKSVDPQNDQRTNTVYGTHWRDTDYLEILLFFTILLSISLMGGGPLHLYWSTLGEGDPSLLKGLWNFGERVVLFFARLVPKQSHIFCDRFFTTPKLCWFALQKCQVYVTGTVMKTKKNLCDAIIFKKSQTCPRGFFGWALEGTKHVMMCCWMDRTPVLCVSSMIGVILAAEGIKRLSAADGTFRKVFIKCPLMLKVYNKLMGGVDSFDRLKLHRRGSLEMTIFCHSWVKKYIFALFDMALTNAYVIAKYSRPSLTHREFLVTLSKQLLAKALGRPIPGNRGEITGRKRSVSRAFDSATADGDSHQLLDFLVESDHYWGAVKSAQASRKPCFVCKKKDMGYYWIKGPGGPNTRKEYYQKSQGCKPCGVMLCHAHFFEFHREYSHLVTSKDTVHPRFWKDEPIAPPRPPPKP